MSLKAVIFDFDGTLSAPNNSNIWNDFWDILGYSREEGSEYSELGGLFFGGKIDYQTWCNMTCEKFMNKGFDREKMLTCSRQTNMLNDIGVAFNKLNDMGLQIGICSGNCDEVIKDCLGDDYSRISVIQANRLIFDEQDKLTAIIADYDCYEGKAEFLADFMSDRELNPNEVLFVGNGSNDEWAYQSGVNTLCINPEADVRKDDRTIWHGLIEKTDSLLSVVDYVENFMETQSQPDM